MPDSQIAANVTIADFVNVDQGGKANIIGGGLTLLGFDAQQGVTHPFAIFVRVSSPLPREDRPALEIVLVDASGQPVLVPGPMNEPQAIRISQVIEFPAPAHPGVHIPAGAVPSVSQYAINFSNGLPLAPGHSYSWRVQIDHDIVTSESFFVPIGVTGPVIG